MRNHCINKIIGVIMTLIVLQIHIKITHYKKKFIFFGYFLHNIVNIIVEFINVCIRMSISTATENILAFSIFNFNPNHPQVLVNHFLQNGQD